MHVAASTWAISVLASLCRGKVQRFDEIREISSIAGDSVSVSCVAAFQVCSTIGSDNSSSTTTHGHANQTARCPMTC